MFTDKMNILNEKLDHLQNTLSNEVKIGTAKVQNELDTLKSEYDILNDKTKEIKNIIKSSTSELKTAAELGLTSKTKEDIEASIELISEEISKTYDKIKKITG